MRKFNIILIYFLLATSISFAQNPRTSINITAAEATVSSYTDKAVTIPGKTNLHITTSTNSLNNSTIDLGSLDSWVIFDNIRPQTVINNLLQYFTVNNLPAVNKSNIRVAIYKQGAVVIPHSSSIQPLTVYKDQNFTGDSASYTLHNFNNSLGAFDNGIRSFKLKRGYMATLANSSDGTGYSRVFIADDNDLEVKVMPDLLDKTISFIRVFSWEYVNKKGWCGSDFNQYNLTNSTWRYDWSAAGSTTPYVEYVPIRQNAGWPGWSEINGKQYVSHLLGYNEPDHTEQSNVTVAQALAQWPEMMKSGLRLGSPACTSFGWLYEFMDSCKARNYRVDYVAIHAYWGGKSPSNWYNDIKYIHTRTGRPIWITEWNNGANWTSEYWPTSDHTLSTANAAKQLSDIKAILNVLDTASFIERYSIYNWVQDCRAMVLGDTLTPAGKYYASTTPPMAYNSRKEVIPTFRYQNPSLSVSFGTKTMTLSIDDPNGDYFDGCIVEKKIGNGEFKEYYNVTNTSIRTISDTIDINLASKIRYRAKSIYKNGTYSSYTNETGFDVTEGDDIQLGNLQFSNVNWNGVFFKKSFKSIPSIILGAPTNFNSTVLLSPRVKLISTSSRFNLQLSAWAYQNASLLSKDETVPYLALASGTYDFGGLKAFAGRNSVSSNWTPVIFSTIFDTIPVVFTTQLLSASANATTVRVRNITKYGFEAKLQKETAVTTPLGTETVSYFAITPGTGKIDNKKIIVGRTADNFVSPTIYRTIYYGDSIKNPVFFTQLQTCTDDTVTATIRCLTVSNKYSNVLKQRERSTGIFTSLTDGAGWMVIEADDILQGINNTVEGSFYFYPNPVKDILYFESKQNKVGEIHIFNLYGVLVKTVKQDENQINVSDLKPGYYLIKSKYQGTGKFIKI